MYICGCGIISPLGNGLTETEARLRANSSALRPQDLFPLLHGEPLPVGQAPLPEDETDALPRTHRLALNAAHQALKECRRPPDAVVLGTTTGGILTTERLLRQQAQDKELFRFHGLHTVADCVAKACGCTGPALTVSTACASGAVALAVALHMLRSGGHAETVLAGGADSLCRLTYFGFHSLQLVDRAGCRPFDQSRQGMSVAEGAALLLLSAVRPERPFAQLIGAGLSCDAWHPAAPHPEGKGAFAAMQAALRDAGLRPEDIGYINLHGTGTPDNDLAEAKAVRRLFVSPPPLSSIKGASGHSLAAAGAIEAAVAAIAVAHDLLPANTGLQQTDSALGLTPLAAPLEQPVKAVLSNSFGFGGNNAALVIAAPDVFPVPEHQQPRPALAVHGFSCLTGAGGTAATRARLLHGKSAAGMADAEVIAQELPPRLIRRLKRLPRMTLSLAVDAHAHSGLAPLKPAAVFMGTGWGSLADTHDFLARLQESGEQFPSPTDFVGSVHNSPASQAAILFGAAGPNITVSGGEYSFEQALLAAELLLDDPAEPALILAADERHAALSPLLYPAGSPSADGGGAFCVSRTTEGAKCSLRLLFYQSSRADDPIGKLIKALGPAADCALILIGIPAVMHSEGEKQLTAMQAMTALTCPVIRYRQFTGEFASSSAVAAVLAAACIEAGRVPSTLTGAADVAITEHRNRILALGLGEYITAVELAKI